MTRQMVMVGFLQAQNCTNLPCSWRHPQSRDDSHSADYYQEIARILEAGKFHMAFFDDRLAMPDRYGNDHAHTVEYGIRATKMDPLIVLMTMGAVTTRLGLASTCSTTYFEPFDVARRFATLDLMTDGRAAWNVVTSVNDGEALNMGREEHLAPRPALRPGRRVHGGRARPLGHAGTTAPSSSTRRPGATPTPPRSSGSTTRASSSVARAVHRAALAAGPPRHHPGRRQRARTALRRALGRGDLRRRPQHRDGQGGLPGRQGARRRVSAAIPTTSPSATSSCPSPARPRPRPRTRWRPISKLPLEIDALSLLAEALNFDFASKGIDEPFTTEELQGMHRHARHPRRRAQAQRQDEPERARLHQLQRPRPGRQRRRRRAEGDRRRHGGDVRGAAAATASWWRPRTCPGAYGDFVRHVVPELQRRGLYHKDYAGKTLRENLGLPRPGVGAWKTRPPKAAE